LCFSASPRVGSKRKLIRSRVRPKISSRSERAGKQGHKGNFFLKIPQEKLPFTAHKRSMCIPKIPCRLAVQRYNRSGSDSAAIDTCVGAGRSGILCLQKNGFFGCPFLWATRLAAEQAMLRCLAIPSPRGIWIRFALSFHERRQAATSPRQFAVFIGRSSGACSRRLKRPADLVRSANHSFAASAPFSPKPAARSFSELWGYAHHFRKPAFQTKIALPIELPRLAAGRNPEEWIA
jgi:hypothetical protein